MSAPDFLVHAATDTVGVVVVETVHPGQTLTGWVMDTDRTLSLVVLDTVPLGHKLALADIAASDTVIKYGRAVAPVRRGGHVHVHNLKTRRW